MATGIEVIRKAYETQPQLKLAVNRKDNAIGSWDESRQRYVMVAGRFITDNSYVEMPYELLINGNPPIAAEDWIPVPNV